MGTQQILLIVLSVIIVGIAVAVGITMFNTQAQNANRQALVDANRQALVADANNFASQMIEYYKTPTSHGGGGRTFEASMDTLEVWIGFGSDGTYTNDNGTYALTRTNASTITIVGTGTEVGNDGTNNTKITATVTATATDPIGMVVDN